MALNRRGIQKMLSLFFASMVFTNMRAQMKQPVDYVNPFIGTAKSSHRTMWESKGATFPGVLLPFGMVQITPDGYTYPDKKIESFSFLNHMSGYSSNGSFKLMAFSGDNLNEAKGGSAFSHNQESAHPYYYQVMLQNSGINAEFTATERIGLCKFNFPASSAAHFVLSDVTGVKVIDSNAINGRCGEYFFVAQFSIPFSSVEVLPHSVSHSEISPDAAVTPSSVVINYTTQETGNILIKIGFSTTSFRGVENNIEKELPGWDFEQTSLRAKKIWNEKLGKIEIQTPDENMKEVFYTALYHSMFMPVVLSDADAPVASYSALYPWDTYRSEHPLITLLEPGRERDMIASVLTGYDKTGWLPTDNMMGNHNVELILDSYVKGVGNFDIPKACEAICKSLTVPPYARREMDSFVRYKYVPANTTSSVTHSLEFAYNCWAAATLLEKTGFRKKYPAEFKMLTERAGYYKNSFDPEAGFMKAKTASGQWTDGGYAEGTPWTYSWYVPHDVQGLINLMGGKAIFSKRLTACFEKGHYVHDNEPPLHYAYLFNFCGQPWKTQFWARQIVEGSYSADPGGLPGNDDLGTLSSWLVFSAIGFYPVTPGTTQYQIGSPVFNQTTIHLSNGHQFLLKANHVSRKNKYIQSATLNGKPLNRPWLNHEEISAGKILILEMGPMPNKAWGSTTTIQPYSMTHGTPDFAIEDIRINTNAVKANEPVQLAVSVKNNSGVTGTFSTPVYIDGKIFENISTILEPGENKIVHSDLTLYRQGMHTIRLDGTAALKFEVKKTAPSFLYSDLTTPFPPLTQLSTSFNVSAKIKNTGSYDASTPVKLFVNGLESQSKIIALNPGEEKEISFNYKATRSGICNIRIGNLEPAIINVIDTSAIENPQFSKLAYLAPVLIMDFNEAHAPVIHDFSGSGNNGMVKGNLKWVKGIFGEAVQTNASAGTYIAFPDSSSLNQLAETKALTIMAWVYPRDEKNFADIISKGDWNSLQVKGSNQLINFYTNGWEGHEATATVPENWNQHWHHLAGVADGSYFHLYVDGKLVATKKGELRNPKGETGIANYSNSPWNIGRNETAPDRVFNGFIDEVMIFRSALNRQQVFDLMIHNF